MGIYAYLGTEKLGEESLGSEGRVVWRPEEDADWIVAMNFMREAFPGKAFSVYEFVNFYDDKTFALRYTYHGEDGAVL